MKIKKYFAADMRQALNMARQEHGPDVVILGNRKVLGGVELIAADEYDASLFRSEQTPPQSPAVARQASAPPRRESESKPRQSGNGNKPLQYVTTREPLNQQKEGVIWTKENSLEQMQQEIKSLRKLLEQQMSGLAWGDISRRHPLWTSLLRKLGQLGINPAIAGQLVEQVPEEYGMEKAWRTILALLSYRIPIEPDNILTQGSMLAFVGASGTGKTTTIAKLAARYVLEHGPANIVLATLDSYRVGGREQLASYARILGIPMRPINGQSDLTDLVEQYQGRKLILLDTAGLNPNDTHYQTQLGILNSCGFPVRLCLVVSANSQVTTLKQVITAYRPMHPDLCVLTKLDEASTLGSVLSVIIDERLKISWQCNGQRVPEDIHKAESTDLIARAISMAKRYQSERDESEIEQDFGRHVVFNPIGGTYGH